MKCPNQAFYRFTWPGRDESFICTEHVNKLRGVASAMGFHLQIADLSHDEQAQHTCNQEISGGRTQRASDDGNVSEGEAVPE